MTTTTTRLLHEWRYRNGKVICHLCGHESVETRCPKCGRSSSESTIGHGVLGGKMCSWRPADTPCITRGWSDGHR